MAARGLKDEALPIGRPIGFGVLPTVSELVNIGELNGLGGGQGCGRKSSKQHLVHRSDCCKYIRPAGPRESTCLIGEGEEAQGPSWRRHS